jgi:2-iminobutanoate/2-iminopropanoate deaminase
VIFGCEFCGGRPRNQAYDRFVRDGAKGAPSVPDASTKMSACRPGRLHEFRKQSGAGRRCGLAPLPWNWRSGLRGREGHAGAAEALRDVLAYNRAFKVVIAHGMTDLVAPYLTSRYVADHLPQTLTADRVTLNLYPGGHMMYLRSGSRARLHADAGRIYSPLPYTTSGQFIHAVVFRREVRAIDCTDDPAVDGREGGLPRLAGILKAAGADWSRVVKTNVLLMRASDFAEMNRIYGSYFPDGKYPVRTTVIVAGLPHPDFLLEIECEALLE